MDIDTELMEVESVIFLNTGSDQDEEYARIDATKRCIFISELICL